VDVGTKGYPDKYTLKLAAGTGYNSQVTFNSSYLTYPGSSTDWRGVDNGSRDLPQEIRNNPIPPNAAESTTRRDPVSANELDQASKSFSPIMSPITQKAPIDKSMSFSIGNQTSLFGRPFGCCHGI